MTKTRKVIIALLTTCVLVCLSLFTLTACGSSGDLTKIAVTTKPTKIVYISGEKFDATGLVITATFKDKKGKETTKDVTKKVEYDKDVKLTVPSGSFEQSQSITFSYTSGKDSKGNPNTKTAKLSVTVTNKITNATIKTQPDRTSYYLGQVFSPDGMVLNATMQDGTTQEVNVTSSNSTYSTEALGKGTTSVEVTVGGFKINVPVTILNALYVEAETGYRNGAPIEQTTGNTGNLRTDATTENAEKGAKALYESHLKALFAVEQMKAANAAAVEAGTAEAIDFDLLAQTPATVDDLAAAFANNTKSVFNEDVKAGGEIISKLYTETVKWLKNTANKEAIDEYVESEEYTALVEAYLDGTNEDITEWNYEQDVVKYTAHAGTDGNEYYLGQNNSGDTITFLFESDKAATGTVAFRLSSAYLYVDNGNWSAVVMGDLKFNEYFEVYVNGVKQDIGDDMVLEGGKSEDGTLNQSLWVNWFDVEFEKVPFVSGRNVVELKIKNHTTPAQQNYKFATNVDTLIVSPDKDADGVDLCDLDNFDINTKITVTANEVKVEKDGEIALLTINGTYSGVTGYIDDMLSAAVGGVAGEFELGADNTFTATFDVTDLIPAEDAYAITINGTAVNLTAPETAPVTVGYNRYSFKNESNSLMLVVESDAEITSINATGVKLEADGNNVYLVITGNVAWKHYAVEDVAEYINTAIGSGNGSLDFQGPLPGKQDRKVYEADDRTITVENKTDGEEANNYTADLTIKVAINAKVTTAGKYAIHFNGGNLDFLTQEEKDLAAPTGEGDALEAAIKEYQDKFNVSMVDTTTVELGYGSYTLAYEPWYSSQTTFGNAQNNRNEHYYGCVGLNFVFNAELSTTGVGADIAVEDGKVVYIVNGTYTSKMYTEDEIKELIGKIAIDFQGNPYMQSGSWTGNWDAHSLVENLISVTLSSKTTGENTTYTYQAKYDITGLAQSDNYCYTGHYFYSTGASNGDFKPDTASFEKEVVFGNKLVILSYTKGGGNSAFYGCVGLRVTDYDPTAKKLAVNPSQLELDETNNKVYYVITGTCANYSQEELEALVLDFELDGGSKTVATKIVTLNTEDGTFTVKAEITELAVGPYWAHFAKGVISDSGDVTNSAGVEAIICGSKSYAIKSYKFSWGSSTVLVIEDAPEPPAPVEDKLAGTWIASIETDPETTYTVTFADGKVTIEGVEGEGEYTAESTTITVAEGYVITVGEDGAMTLKVGTGETILEYSLTKQAATDTPDAE